MSIAKPAELHIIDGNKNIFDTDIDYVIPLYQRAFAWEDKQLTQLVEDIADVSEKSNYYIGSLIVSKQENKYEVIDGQQRLTSLYLLLNCLGVDVKPTLTFACREKSNYSLKNIKELINDDRSQLDMDRVESSIQRGINVLLDELHKDGFDIEKFNRNLSKVILYRIEVPEHTDLNRYFEIMNTRGEQLEQHDILKAQLMSYLPNQAEQSVFAKIWDACSDMTGYVQMHFATDVRGILFGDDWDEIPPTNWDEMVDAIQQNLLEEDVENFNSKCGKKCLIGKIIKTDFSVNTDEGYVDEDVRVRFESVIDFPYFLIHTLKVLVDINGISVTIAELLDDKKLLDSFYHVIQNGYIRKRKIKPGSFSKEFLVCLLKTRFLFDKYIIKREFVNENSDGEWSLKSLYVSNKKPYYRNTKFIQAHQRKTTNNNRTKLNIMIQSALRVSYTSPKVMHWITHLLIWLSKDIVSINEFTIESEKLAKQAVEEFLECYDNGGYNIGVNTPHIVFNFLDYLIWKSAPQDYDDFVFEFRNSVEHWYPQNPSEGTFERWEDDVDRFGNLCIVQRNVTSKFSNMSPEAKKSTFQEMIKKGSLKLRKMRDETKKQGRRPASLYWREVACEQHENEMISLLKEACSL